MLDPSILRVSVAGNISELPKPKATLAEKFLPFKVSHSLVTSDHASDVKLIKIGG